MSLTEIFDEIYRLDTWKGNESRSGRGAGDRELAVLGPRIAKLVKRRRFKTVVDVGCGEGYWTPELPGYIGFDVSNEALEVARKRHPEWDYRLFGDGLLPEADVVLCRCVIQHLSFADGLFLLEHIRASTRWLLTTSYATKEGNRDIVTGDGYYFDLRRSPFDLGEPVEQIADPGAGDDAFLGLWRLS